MNLPSHILHPPASSPIVSIHLNATGDLFSTAEINGWSMYSVHPFRLLYHRHSPHNVPLRFAVPLYSSNLVVLVAAKHASSSTMSPSSKRTSIPENAGSISSNNKESRYASFFGPNKAVIWDDEKQQPVSQLDFSEDIVGVAVRLDRLVIVLRKRVVIFGLGQGSVGVFREGSYHTCDNPKGLIALATTKSSTLLAFPGRRPGQVTLVNLPPLNIDTDKNKNGLKAPPPTHDPTRAPYRAYAIILAHTSPLAHISIDPSGSLLATASVKGTLIRIWNPSNEQLVRELRRGSDPADIFDIRFRRDGKAVCVTSDKGTIHIWHLNSSQPVAIYDDPKHPVSLIKPYLPKYFSSEWSHSSFKLPPPSLVPSRHLPLPNFLQQPADTASSPATSGPSELSVENDVCICTWVQSTGMTAGFNKNNEDDGTAIIYDNDLSSLNKKISSSSLDDIECADDSSDDDEIDSASRNMDIVVLARSGAWYRLQVGKNGGGCKMVEHRRFDRKDGWD